MKISVNGPLLRFVGFQKSLEFAGATVDECLGSLIGTHPAMGSVLYDDAGSLRRTHQVFLNGDPLDDPNAEVNEEDELHILTALAGG